MIYLDTYSNKSVLRTLHPAIKLGYFAMMLCSAFCSHSLLMLVALLLTSLVVTFSYTSIAPKAYFRVFGIPVLFVLLGLVPIALVSVDKQTDGLFNFTVLGENITRQSLFLTIKIFLRSAVCISNLFFLILTTPISHFLWLLRCCKVPALVIDLTALIYSNIFTILHLAQTVFVAQKSRLAYSSLWGRNKQFAQLLSRSFVLSVKKVNEQYNSLEARCYDGEFHFINYEFTASRATVFLLAAVAMVSFVGCLFSYYYQWM